MSNKFSFAKQTAIWNKTNGKCWYCGIELIRNTSTVFGRSNSFVVEHVVNRGSDDISNLVPSCGNCNRRKRNRTLEEFRNFLTAPNFTERQIEFLLSYGIQIPKPDKYVFYGETL